jgi:DNA recombination protein RmuC
VIVVAVLCIVGICIAVAYAMQKSAAEKAAASRATDLERQLVEAESVESDLIEMRLDMRGRDEQLAAERQRLNERDTEVNRLRHQHETELERLRGEQKQDRTLVSDQSDQIKALKGAIEQFQRKQDDFARSTLEAAGSNQRIESTLLDWTRQIASPQGRGAFGELALRNQLLALGLEEGRDFSKQVTQDGGGQRVDFVVRLGDPVVAIDSKLANDPGLSGLSEALAAGDPERLRAFGRKLRDHAKALARKDYWKGLDRSPSLTFMYVPIEGAMAALNTLDDFDATKFFNQHRVCVITPSQLAIALILVAEVCHAERKEEHIEELLSSGHTMAEAMGKFLDNYAKLGRKLNESVTAFNGGAAMATSRGQLWQQVVKPLSEFAPTREIGPELKELEPPRDDVIDIADRYRLAADEMRHEAPAVRESADRDAA